MPLKSNNHKLAIKEVILEGLFTCTAGVIDTMVSNCASTVSDRTPPNIEIKQEDFIDYRGFMGNISDL